MEKSITQIVKDYLKQNGVTQAFLAEALKQSPQNLANKLRKHDLDTSTVKMISMILKHDFFDDLSRQLPFRNPVAAEPQPRVVEDLGSEYVKLLKAHITLQEELRNIIIQNGK